MSDRAIRSIKTNEALLLGLYQNSRSPPGSAADEIGGGVLSDASSTNAARRKQLIQQTKDQTTSKQLTDSEKLPNSQPSTAKALTKAKPKDINPD